MTHRQGSEWPGRGGANFAAPVDRSGGILARLRAVQQRVRALSSAIAPSGDLLFLVGRLIDAATLLKAQSIARDWGVAPHEVLISLGWVAESDYVAALAEALGCDWLGRAERGHSHGRSGAVPTLSLLYDGEILVEAYAATPDRIREQLRRLPHHVQPVLATRRDVDALRLARAGEALIDHAIDGLWRADPRASARSGAEPWQIGVIATIVVLCGVSLTLAPAPTMSTLMVLMTAPFLCIGALRLAALVEVLRRPARPSHFESVGPRADASLPHYTALIPLYREARVVPDLVDAMAALDYPAAKLDVMLVLEASDRETVAAVAALDLPGNVRPVIVPDKGPRTKPKALNYALDLVQSPYVVVFDAEDIPEPRQIREALAAFSANGPDLGCVQARLGIHNASQGWLARQFALEYASLFDAQLPALDRLGLPIPLGGTSNHFRVEVLRAVGGWDPFNVTEDADLGLRLARRGYRTATLGSTTWEEAPIHLTSWIKQRTRWLKGWMQTYIVVTRRPLAHVRELGLRRALGLHLVMGGMMLSALVHPLCLAWIGYQSVAGGIQSTGDSVEAVLLAVAMLNLVLGYTSAMAAGAAAAWKRGWSRTAASALAMPLYWLLVSLAAYRALVQLVHAPHLWEKTEHGHSIPRVTGGQGRRRGKS